jgi:DNA-binding transcriptional ArsR family regulator
VSPTPHEPRLARVAAMIADPARSRMLAYLLDGQYASAGELARAAGVQPSTASAHLDKLIRADFVVCEPRGRHRYFKLADGEVAQALQALSLIAERNTHDRAWAHPQRQRLREARCCYGHVAGRLGVALWTQLQRDERLREKESGAELTGAGRAWLATLGFTPMPARAGQRLAYGCLDWSERRDHLAGSLGRQLLEHFIAKGWVRQRTKNGNSPP